MSTRPLALALLLLAACDRGDRSAAVASDAAACGKLADRLCETAGAESQSCSWVRRVSTVMGPGACEAALADADGTASRLQELLKPCTDLANRLCAGLGEEAESCKMVRRETPKMGPDQCEGMAGQFDAVLADLKGQEARNAPLSDDLAAAIAGGEAPGWGPATAPVTVVVFSDFQCPYCSRALGSLGQLEAKYGEKTRVVFRNFPLPFHAEAHLAAQAALAAHAQGKFKAYHDKLFAAQDKLGRADLEQHASELGLDMAAFKKALDEGTFKAAVDADLDLGSKVSVDGTPTIFIGKKRMVGAELEAMSAAVDGLLAGG